MWGCKITQGCSTASPSPTRRGQPSPERCAPPSPPTYASSSPCHSSLAMYMGRLCSLWATTKSSKVRAAISRTLCSSISSILYLFITSLPQFDVAHGQALLYVGHHHVLQGKGIDLQNVVLLHLDLTPVWRSTWSGSALCGPPPSPPHEPELQTHSLSLLIF